MGGKERAVTLGTSELNFPPRRCPSPTGPMLPNQLLLAVRRPPMISSSKADVVWGVGEEERGPTNGFDQNSAQRKSTKQQV